MVMILFRKEYIDDISTRAGLRKNVRHPSVWDKLQDPIWSRIWELSIMWWMFE